jgi:hypothetical protein
LSWYFDNVLLQNRGVPKEKNFPLQLSYWIPFLKGKNNHQLESQYAECNLLIKDKDALGMQSVLEESKNIMSSIKKNINFFLNHIFLTISAYNIIIKT